MKSEIMAGGSATIETAYKHFEELKQIKGVHAQLALRVGEIAHFFKTTKLYKDLGYDSMRELFADPELNTYAEQTVRDYMYLYEKYELGLGIDHDRLQAIGPWRLKQIAGKVDADPEEWLSKAESLSRSDLIIEVRGESVPRQLPPSQGGDMEDLREMATPLALTIDEYKDWVRQQPCCVCNDRPPSHYAHWPVVKAKSEFGIPLCNKHHIEIQHGQGDLSFFEACRWHIGVYLEGLFRE